MAMVSGSAVDVHRKKNNIGAKHGRLTQISEATKSKGTGNHRYAKYQCECGKEIEVCCSNVSGGRQISCGCSRFSDGINKRLHHGSYRSWQKMIDRVTNPKHPHYEMYKTKTICERWLSFAGFLEDMGERPEGLTLDRISNALGYSKENCRWASMKDQNRNKTNGTKITINGVTKSVTEWSEAPGAVTRHVIYYRLRYGWSGEQAVFSPVRRRHARNMK